MFAIFLHVVCVMWCTIFSRIGLHIDMICYFSNLFYQVGYRGCVLYFSNVSTQLMGKTRLQSHMMV